MKDILLCSIPIIIVCILAGSVKYKFPFQLRIQNPILSIGLILFISGALLIIVHYERKGYKKGLQYGIQEAEKFADTVLVKIKEAINKNQSPPKDGQ